MSISTIDRLTRPENCFLLLSVIFGFIFMVVTPPLQIPDERAHFLRAYQISDLELLSDNTDNGAGGRLPASLVDPVHQVINKSRSLPGGKLSIAEFRILSSAQLDPDDRKFIRFHNTAVYSPVPYIVPAIAISIGKFFDSSPLILMYLGRIANLIVWLGLIYFAIKIMPAHKWLMTVLAVMPTTLSEAASLSADMLTNGLAFILIALCLRHAVESPFPISHRQAIVLCLLTVMLSLCKNVYFIYAGLFLLIPHKGAGERNRLYGFVAISLFINILAITGWYWLVSDIIIRSPFPTASKTAQISFVLNHPLPFLSALMNTISVHGSSLAAEFVAQLAAFDILVHPTMIKLFYVVLLLCVLLDSDKQITLSIQNKLVIGAVSLVTISLIGLALYIYWSPVGHHAIEGLQGRYYIPIAPLLFLVLYRSGINRLTYSLPLRAGLMLFLAGMLSHSIYVLLKRYWIA